MYIMIKNSVTAIMFQSFLSFLFMKASTQFPQELAENIIRHMNAAHVAGYCGLDGPYSKKHFFDHYNKEWNMLTEKEMDQLAHYDWNDGSDVLKELCTWCQRDVGLAKKLGHIDSMEAVELHTRIVAFRAAMDGKLSRKSF